jgi:anti-sigma B factor antagonist
VKSRVEPLSIAVSTEQGGTLLTVKGWVTIDSSPTLRDRLLAILRQESPRALTIDLTAVPYIDCSGLATLLEGLKMARAGNTIMRLSLHERPRYLMEVTGLLTLFETPHDGNRGAGSKGQAW